MCLTDVILVIL